MKLSSILGIRGARDKPRDSYNNPTYSLGGVAAGNDIVNISLHFFLKDVRTMQHALMRGNIVIS